MISRIWIVIVFGVCVAECRSVDKESQGAPCGSGPMAVLDGQISSSDPENCTQMVCRNGKIIQEIVGNPGDTDCCLGFYDKMYSNGYKIADTCLPIICANGSWIRPKELDPCCGFCQVYSLGHVRTFDNHNYDWCGVCNYTVAATEHFNGEPDAAVYAQMDRYDGNGTIISQVTFRSDPNTIIKVTNNSVNEVELNGETYVIPYMDTEDPITVFLKSSAGYNSVLAYVRRDCLLLFGTSFTLRHCPNHNIHVVARKMLMGGLYGLCGNFNRDVLDDFTDPTRNVLDLEEFPAEFPVLWRAPDQIKNMCAEESESTSTCDYELCLTAEAAMRKEHLATCTEELRSYTEENPELQYMVPACAMDLCLVSDSFGAEDSVDTRLEEVLDIVDDLQYRSGLYLFHPDQCVNNSIPVVMDLH